jgi:uncharacterized protein YndB with AHSA1/START domain
MSADLRASITVAAPASRVYRALTDSTELATWFAEYADVSPTESRYDFWGRFTPEAPSRIDGRHHLLAAHEPQRLAFSWRLRGEETTVEIDLAEHTGVTEVTATHRGLPERRMGELSYHDLWETALINLQAWVETGRVGLQPDYAYVPVDAVEHAIDIDAPAAAVFAAISEPVQLDRYIGHGAVVEPRIGGRIDFGWGDGGPLRILDIAPRERLSYSWNHKDPHDTVVTWTLAGSGGRTRLTLVHSGFTADRKPDDYYTGWAAFMNAIRMVAERPAWQPPVVSYLRVDAPLETLPA